MDILDWLVDIIYRAFQYESRQEDDKTPTLVRIYKQALLGPDDVSVMYLYRLASLLFD